MKKYAIIFNISLIIQSIESNNSQEQYGQAEYIILLICFVIASIIMMLIPVILCYSMVGNFLAIRYLNNRTQTESSLEISSSNFLKSIREKYIKATENFYKNLFALATWNVFSMVYVISEFDTFVNGLKEYFYFPLNVFQSLSKDKIFESIHEFQSNWIFMVGIVILTFVFYFIGKYFGNIVAKTQFEKLITV